MNLFRTKEFQALKEYWDHRLKESGFEDIESSKGHLKKKNNRTIAFHNRDRISEFFTKLMTFLHEQQDIPELHREILSLYAEGMHIKGHKGIIHKVNKSDFTVRMIIKKYKLLILKY